MFERNGHPLPAARIIKVNFWFSKLIAKDPNGRPIPAKYQWRMTLMLS